MPGSRRDTNRAMSAVIDAHPKLCHTGFLYLIRCCLEEKKGFKLHHRRMKREKMNMCKRQALGLINRRVDTKGGGEFS